ncbi:MAG: cupin-like domain-containing protein [Myxococcota bacterium]
MAQHNEAPLLLGGQLQWREVECLTELDAARFRSDYLERNRPALIRGAVAEWPALTRWTNDYLRRAIGHCRVLLETAVDQFEGRVFDDVEEIEVTFGEFLDRMITPQGRSDYFVGHWLRPELVPDLGPLPLAEVMGGPFYRRRMIMTRGGNRIACHFDWYENLVCQIAGWKRVILCSPLDTPALRPLAQKPNYSSFDALAPDLEAYPEVAHISIYVAIVRPGDVLYIPTQWWHSVESFERNIMISTAFVERDAALCGIIEGLLDHGRLGLSGQSARTVRSLLSAPRPISALARFAEEIGSTALGRHVGHRRALFR